jgi:HAMP domain-containing protein
MKFSSLHSLGALVRLLLGAMLAVLLAALVVPTWSAIQQRTDAARVAALAHAGETVFAALQQLRLERGVVRVARLAADPVIPPMTGTMRAGRDKSAAALDIVLRDCPALRCAEEDPRLDALRGDSGRLLAARRDAEAAASNPSLANPKVLILAWDSALTDTSDRLDRLSAALTEQVRLVDPEIAELMAIKQLGWMVRDAAGLERTLYSTAIDAKAISPDLLLRMAGYRARVGAEWSAVQELTRRPGMPVSLVAAVHGATTGYFDRIEKLRGALHAALLAGQPPPIALPEWMRVSNDGLDALMAVPNAAVAEAGAYAENRAAAARQRLWLQLGLLLFGLTLGGLGFMMVQRRITGPIRAMTATMRKLAQGDMAVAIAGEARRDEIGEMAAAVTVFRDGLLRAERLAGERESQQEPHRRNARERRPAMPRASPVIRWRRWTPFRARQRASPNPSRTSTRWLRTQPRPWHARSRRAKRHAAPSRR